MTGAQKSRSNKLKPELEIETESEDNTDSSQIIEDQPEGYLGPKPK